jgi:hypothetical protein
MSVRALTATLQLMVGLLAVFALPVAAQLASDAYEESPIIRAANILPADVRQSGHHRVRDEVLLKGGMYVFDIDSDYGLYRVESFPMLVVRSHELRTLAQAIGQYKQADSEFTEQLRGQLTYDANSLIDVVKAPFSMAGQLVSNIGQTAQEFSELGNESGQFDEPKSTEYVDEISKDIISGTHKRNVAFQLDLDPYSTNPKVQEFLNTVARARSGGHFKAGVATVRVPPSRLISVNGGKIEALIKNAVKSLSPAELNQGIDSQLEQLGVDEQTRRAFLTHPHYSPRHKTAITAYLDYLRGVGGRAVLIEAALVARGEADAKSFEMLALMLAYYHETVSPLGELRLLAELPMAMTSTGDAVVVMPVDHVYWDRANDKLFAELREQLSLAGHANPEFVLGGTLSDRARAGLEGNKFRYREDFLNAP